MVVPGDMNCMPRYSMFGASTSMGMAAPIATLPWPNRQSAMRRWGVQGYSMSGTTPINRGELSDGLKKRGSFGHPSRCDLPVRARSRREEASDEPADAMLPQSGLPGQRPGGAGEHSRA